MDYWLGDSALFPQPMCEWHSESIWRLPRCFIAWNPPNTLPEGNIDFVASSHKLSQGIHFGSFNHHRKLSDSTLNVWGRILSLVPDSRLVLKSGHKDDRTSSQVLRRRMIRCGLDPARVIWLPRTASALEHLNQYSMIDVALDCFPNGGCTTTCESLWMGVPVLTLTGSTYVSRMSTSVLHGAGLSHLCAENMDKYIQLACDFASNVAWLRQNRHYWRESILNSPLGNPLDLFESLEESFYQMTSSL